MICGLPVTAAADEADCFPSVDPDSGHVMSLAWQTDSAGDVEAALDLRALNQDGLSYALEGRVVFRDLQTTWSQTVGELDPYGSTTVAISLPAAAALHDDQADWLSDVFVHVMATNTDGDVIRTQAAPRLRLAVDGGAFVLLSVAAAATEAPGGAYSEAAAAGLPADAGAVHEYGGEGSCA